MNTNIVTDVRLQRPELIQLCLVVGNRLDDLRNSILDTDYMDKYGAMGQDYAERVKHDDQRYAHDLQIILAKLAHALG
jgi:hypothetical protein